MNHSGHIFCGVFSPIRRIRHGNTGNIRLSACRRFALILALCTAVGAFCAACSSVDSAGTIPRNGVHAPRKAHRLTVITDMLFEFGNNPLEKKTVNIPEGEYVFEAEDDIFMYFRSPEPLEYRVNHKEGYADGFFQMGGIALASPSQWDNVKYPVCTYIDGEDQHQKRLTCPLDPAFVIEKRGFEWESDFDLDLTAPLPKAQAEAAWKISVTKPPAQTDADAKVSVTEPLTQTDAEAKASVTEPHAQTDADAKTTETEPLNPLGSDGKPYAVPVVMQQTQHGTDE